MCIGGQDADSSLPQFGCLFPNLEFLYFATVTGESYCGGLDLFGSTVEVLIRLTALLSLSVW